MYSLKRLSVLSTSKDSTQTWKKIFVPTHSIFRVLIHFAPPTPLRLMGIFLGEEISFTTFSFSSLISYQLDLASDGSVLGKLALKCSGQSLNYQYLS